MVKYMVAAKVTMRSEDVEPYLQQPFSPGLVGYKLVAGLSIAYVLPEVCNEGIKAGIIEPPDPPLKEITYQMMRSHIGIDCHECLSSALIQSSVNYLKRQLERINDGPKTVGVKVYFTEWYEGEMRLKQPKLTPMEEICVDLEHREILSYQSFLPQDWFFPFPLFDKVKTYEHFLDCLVRKQYIEYLNTGSLFERFLLSEFYDADRFDQKIYKLVFSFGPERMVDKGEERTEVSIQEAETLDRQHDAMWQAIKDFLEKTYFPRADAVPIPSEQAVKAEQLRQSAESFSTRDPKLRLWRVSDEDSLAYTALARQYVHELMDGNPAVMRDIAHSYQPFGAMGDSIILAGSLLWLMSPCNGDGEEEMQNTCRLARSALIDCYAVAQRATPTRWFSLFRHWLLIGMPEREILEAEWLVLLKKVEDAVLAWEN